ncbi:NAD(P)/FAD-dependent oxidoreductase [Sulfurimonas paralvinellae]|uniref:Sulfide:quinone reductase n=1 Tax=Sulfurimonas paralvinellae TaxID=317658 RepID=A0A7M1B553_9BACT|nr:FAD-dependent oxidoreductase [Sulfurimonas paralvinellae]QOP44867.1 sulfide:quinone reductase [Sulfurimonas paralvinellae]
MKKVLVLGGGFAGVDAATHLQKMGYDVTLVSDRDYFYIYPTSIWIPTHESEFQDVCVNLDEFQRAHGFKVIVDSVESISKANNSVAFTSGKVIDDYDYLIIAIGASKMKPQGVEHTLSICGAPEQSLEIRDALDRLVEKGSGKIAMGFGGNPKDTSAVRGGPGFELLFNVHNMLKKKGIRDNFELTFFAPMAEPGKRMGPQALKMMDVFFSKLGIHKHFGKKITKFEDDGVVFEDDSRLESDLTMFIPAGNGHAVIKNSDLPQNEAGFVKTDDYSCVLNEDGSMSNIYAIGDVAALEGYEWRAKQGHIAEVMAKNCAHNIEQRDNGGNNFKGYNEHLNILCVMDSGDGAAFVYRDEKRAFMFPMPFIGHWMKKAWGFYCRNSKLGKIPRIPGM